MTWYNFTFILLLFCSDVGDSPSDHVQEDMDSEVYPSEDGECFVFAMRREYGRVALCNGSFYTMIHFYNPCRVGLSTLDLWCITVATQASFVYLVRF